MEDGISLIMVDEMDWETLLGPQYIVGINRELIPIYIGHYLNTNTMSIETDRNAIGLWVKTTDYYKIDHTKFYVFIHDYDMDEDELNEIMDNIEANVDDSLTVDESDQLHRSHYHIGINIEEQLQSFQTNYLH